MTPFAEVMRLAYQCEPSGTIRFYYSNTLDSWFANMLKHPTSSATISGNGKTAEETLELFAESARRFIADREAEASGRLPVDPRITRAAAEMSSALKALEIALVANHAAR